MAVRNRKPKNRKEANYRERIRTQILWEAFRELAKRLPTYNPNAVYPVIRIRVLRDAINYIQYLTNLLAAVDNNNNNNNTFLN